jgi:Cdc6-like AAA superfamily ATPase
VVQKLGAGGMGVVYEAEDRDKGGHVALKTLQRVDPDEVLRFKSEFRTLQHLEHPNLVRFGELFEEGGLWFFTMELVAGVDFLSYVRPDERFARHDPTMRAGEPSDSTPVVATHGGFDEERVRHTLGQLATGLHALHSAGKIHRDIKPSNVRITPEGRVVLLDFGLAIDRTGDDAPEDEAAVGTAIYMAPEQAAAKTVGPEADWYSVGVMLYEALAGRPPFVGSALTVMTDKQRADPVPPQRIAPVVPDDLAALCMELLRHEPSRRPTGDVIVGRLAGAATPPRALLAPSLSGRSTFVGRRSELEALASACDRARNGRCTCVLVEGESGVGKSALVRRFLDTLATIDPSATVLRGRCYERESVPYKAFDGIVDALSRTLRRLARAEVAALAPRHASLLPQVFPVLARVDAIAELPKSRDLPDPQELRARVFAALRELFAGLGKRNTLVLTIDDLQWADGDSFALLADLLRPPDAPALLLVATTRPLARDAPDPAAALPGLQRLTLGRLSSGEAEELASALLQRFGLTASQSAASLASEAAGHPLFIDELVHHASQGGSRGDRKLDDALWARVAALDGDTRELLELCAVAGGPLMQEIATEALGVGFPDLDRRLSALRVASLARSTGSRRTDTAETYHDRVREAVLAHLAPETRRRWHERLARSLESSGHADAELLAEHWQGAGDLVRAADHAEAAAHRAAEALAFDRAARLYRRVLNLRPPDDSTRRQLQERLGSVLVNAGRGTEAAQAFLAATAGATTAESLELQRRAAEQLLRSGHVDEGTKAIRNVLAAVGMSFPESPRAALVSLLLRRARLRLQGLGFTARDRSQVSAEELTRIDVSWSVAAGLAVVDPLRGADFQTRNLLGALRAGEPYRVARALAMEAAFVASSGVGAAPRVARILERAREIAEREGDPHAIGLQIGMTGLAAYLFGRWREALDKLDEAERILRDRCVGVAWELDTVQLFGLEALSYLGELREVDRRLTHRIREARDRGDLYAITHLRTGYLNSVWLVRDDVAGAQQEVEDAMAGWSQTAFHAQHLYALFAQTQTDIYRGEGEAARRRVEERWPDAARSLLFRVQFARATFLHLRLRSTLAAARQLPTTQRAPLLRHAEADIRRLASERTPYSAGWEPLARSALCALRGDDAGACRQLKEAAAALDRADMRLYAAAARYCRSRIAGESAQAEADAGFLRDQGIVNVARMVAVHAPGVLPD